MLFGVFDGHGGDEVALYIRDYFKDILVELPSFKKGNYSKALIEAFLKVDASVKGEEYAKEVGATACVVLITPDKIICANAGDSRGVLKCGPEAIPLSEDHKPNS